jgi:tetratricopeptide (TPR) repeat protein
MISSPRGPFRPGQVLVVVVTAGLVCGLLSCGFGDTALAPNAERSSAALSAGLVAHQAGRLKVASIDYHLALDYNHRNKFALFNLGLMDAANGKDDLAEEKYRGVLALDPAYGPALFNLAILRTLHGDTMDAVGLYERAVAANGKAAGAWLNLGLLQRAQGQRAAGDRSVLRAVTLNPRLGPNLRNPLKANAFRSPVAAPTATPAVSR